MKNKSSSLTGVILAGGRGRRMGGQDKGLVTVAGQTLVNWTTQSLAPQVDDILIVANRHRQEYGALGYPVISDKDMEDEQHPGEFLGPLAGFEAALNHTRSEWIVTCPVDAPLLAKDYVQRLMRPLAEQKNTYPAVVARCNGFLQSTHVLLKRSTLPSLQAYLNDGGRKVSTWLQTLPALELDFDEQVLSFLDADTPEQLLELEAKLKQHLTTGSL